MAAKRGIQLRIQGHREKTVMRLNGKLDDSSACQVENVLRRLHGTFEGRKLIFDLEGVRNFEYFGIAILANSIRSQRKHFQEIILTGLQPSAESVFKRFGLTCVPVA